MLKAVTCLNFASINSVQMGYVKTFWESKNTTKKVIEIYLFLLLTYIFVKKKRAHLNPIDTLFNLNYSDTAFCILITLLLSHILLTQSQ